MSGSTGSKAAGQDGRQSLELSEISPLLPPSRLAVLNQVFCFGRLTLR
jgi:hypothetical protein